MLIVAGTLDVAPEQRADLLEAAQPLMHATHQEPGNHEYVFSASPIDDGRVHIFEIWESQSDLDTHFTLPHMAEWGQKMGTFDVKGASLLKYEIASSGPLRG